MSAIPRNEGESFEDYKVRRAADARASERAAKGVQVWDSYYSGTYKNPQRAVIKAERKARKATNKGNK